MDLYAVKATGAVPETMRYPSPGFYYVRRGLGWTVKEWDGRKWWACGSEIPDDHGQEVIAKVPDIPAERNTQR